MKRLIPASLFVVLAFVTGCVFDSDDNDTKKGSISGKVTMIVTGEPVAGIKVMLVNKDTKVDTTDYSKNASAFVDSAMTGADGTYTIDGIKPGNYSVVPINADSVATYKFSLSQDSDTYVFSMNGESRKVNFFAEKIIAAGADGSVFTIVLYLKNGSYVQSVLNTLINRRYWVGFLPFIQHALSYKPEVVDNTTQKILFQSTYGYTALFYSLDNWFTVWPGGDNDCEFEFGFPISSTPAYSVFEYDFNTKTLTRKE